MGRVVRDITRIPRSHGPARRSSPRGRYSPHNGEDEELPEAQSTTLLTWYEQHGLKVVRAPVEDFTVPELAVFVPFVETLVLALMEGKNALCHCWDGSGRTGTMVLGLRQ